MSSGGLRPTAPQNSPINVSGTGGNGQNKDAVQAARYIPGQPQGQGVVLNAQQTQAPMAGNTTPQVKAPTAPSAGVGNVQPLNSPSQRPNEPVTAGAPMGPGPGTEALPSNLGGDPRMAEQHEVIAKYLPALVNASHVPGTPDSFKRFVNYLLGQ